MLCAVNPLDQRISYDVVPPEMLTVAVPFAKPQDALVEEVAAVGPGILFTLTDVVAVQPLLSVTVME